MWVRVRVLVCVRRVDHTNRDDQGHLILRKRVAPHSEVIRVIDLEGSPCCSPAAAADGAAARLSRGAVAAAVGARAAGRAHLPAQTSFKNERWKGRLRGGF